MKILDWLFPPKPPSPEHLAELRAYKKAEEIASNGEWPTDPEFLHYANLYQEELKAEALKFESISATSTAGTVRTWFTPGEVVMYAHHRFGKEW